MSDIVYILGAGASVDTGAPVMANFLEVANDLSRSPGDTEYKDDFDKVFRAISNLQIAQSKSTIDLSNLESVYGALEMGSLVDKLPSIPSDDIQSILFSIKRVIFRTLEKTVKFSIVGDHYVAPNSTYDSFCNLLKERREDGTRRSTSIISFNYDISLDHALHYNQMTPNYYLDDYRRGQHTLLKLHGSLNWAQCVECNSVIPWTMQDYLSKIQVYAHGDDGDDLKLTIASNLKESKLTHCGVPVSHEPLIIPPTWNKTQYQSPIKSVWVQAAKELSEAEYIFVIGYSLPETDAFFTYLYSMGAIGDRTIRRFSIFDPSPSDEIEKRYKKLISPTVASRFKRHRERFKDSFDIIRNELNS